MKTVKKYASKEMLAQWHLSKNIFFLKLRLLFVLLNFFSVLYALSNCVSSCEYDDFKSRFWRSQWFCAEEVICNHMFDNLMQRKGDNLMQAGGNNLMQAKVKNLMRREVVHNWAIDSNLSTFHNCFEWVVLLKQVDQQMMHRILMYPIRFVAVVDSLVTV